MMKVIPKAWSYAFSVTDGAESVAQAVDLSWWRDMGELRVQGAVYRAQRDKSSYVLESEDGVIARAPEGLFTRRAAVNLPQALPLFLQVFIIWLAMTLWKHDDSAGG